MASQRITRADLYPDGTTVTAYPAANWSQAARPPSGAPVGSSEGTAGVMASGAATLTNLSDGKDFFAYGLVSGEHRYLSFRTASTSGLSHVELKRQLQLPAGVIEETYSRDRCLNSITPISGTLTLCGLVLLRAGVPVSSIGTQCATANAGAVTNQWMCLLRPSDRAVLAITEDRLAEAFVAAQIKNFAIASPYVPQADQLAQVAYMMAAGTLCSVYGFLANAVPFGAAPIMGGTSSTGLTTPASLGATAGAITATNQQIRAWVG